MSDSIVVNPPVPVEVAETAAQVAVAESEARVAVEETAQATAVEVAQIEADKTVAVAEIHAETDRAAIETAAEVAKAVTREEFEECRRNIEMLTTQVQTVAAGVLSIQEQLKPLPPNPPEVPGSEKTANPGTTNVDPAPEPPPKKRSAVKLI